VLSRCFTLAVLAVATVSCVARRPDASAPSEPSRCHDVVGPAGEAAALPIRWRPAADAEDRRSLANWCRAVGPALAAPSPRAPDGSTRDDDTIVVVSWNVHLGGSDIVGFVDALRAGRFTNGVRVAGVILLLQEAFRAGGGVPVRVPPGASVARGFHPRPAAGPRIDITNTAAALGMSLFYVPSMRNGAGEPPDAPEDRGNAILATRSLSDLEAIELPFERQRRVAVAATVGGRTSLGTPWTLRVVSAHLDVLASPRRLWLFSSGFRATQARALVQVLSDAEAIVVGADMNTWSEGPLEPAPIIMKRAFDDTPPIRMAPTFGGLFLLDYLFVRLPDQWRPVVLRSDDDFGSDHRPLVGFIRVSGAG
jgi:endonuclease/exonuclease/phosphatase family metal-dependent hydrolase